MSKRAVEWVKAFEASGGVWMPRSHWRALRAVAAFYHEGLGCAFNTVDNLADTAGMSGRHMRRTITELNEMGVVRRNLVQRTRDKSDTSNEYELPGYRLVDADPAMRGRIFSIARERIAEQAALQLDGREDDLTPWMLFLVRLRIKNARFTRRDVEGGCPVVPSIACSGLKTEGVEGIRPAIVFAAKPRPAPCNGVDCALECPRGEDALSGAPRTPCPPVDLTFEENGELEPPYAPPCDGGSVEIAEEQPQRQRPADQGVGSGKVVVFPQRHCMERDKRPRQPRRARSASAVRKDDGEDAALWDEATRVMRACGVSPESSGRKVRRAVLEALRLECERSGRPIASAGLLMEKRWHEYEALGALRYAPLGFTRFIAEGEWLRPNGWRLDRDVVQRMERSAEARVGSLETWQALERVRR